MSSLINYSLFVILQVADKYSEAETAFETESVKNYMPYSWLSMVQVKSHHYRALSHYYAGLGLLEQHGMLMTACCFIMTINFSHFASLTYVDCVN